MAVGNFPLMTRKEGGREEEKVGRSGLRSKLLLHSLNQAAGVFVQGWTVSLDPSFLSGLLVRSAQGKKGEV